MYTANIRSECLVPNAPPRSKDIYIHMQVHAKKKPLANWTVKNMQGMCWWIIPRNYTNMQQKNIHLSLRLLSNTTVSSTTQPSPEHQIPSNKNTPVLQAGNAMGRWPSGTLFLSRFWLWGNASISDLMILISNGSNYIANQKGGGGRKNRARRGAEEEAAGLACPPSRDHLAVKRVPIQNILMSGEICLNEWATGKCASKWKSKTIRFTVTKLSVCNEECSGSIW